MYQEAYKLNWLYHDLIFVPDQSLWWSQSHAQCPVLDPVPLERGKYRIYFSSRDIDGKSRIGSCIIDVARMKIIQRSSEPDLELGSLGAFDDAGVMPAAVLHYKNTHYMLYIGWMERKSVPYQNAIGLSSVTPDGKLQRVYPGPVLSAWGDEAFFTGTISLIEKDDELIGYYLSCTEWLMLQGKAEPRYEIKIASTKDLLHWKREGKAALTLDSRLEGGYASASVLKLKACYLMFYCLRSVENYRSDPIHSYKIHMAISNDAFNWKKLPIPPYKAISSFDQQMQCYPQVLLYENKVMMFYNGDHFGKNGFGCASIDIAELEALCQIYKTS